MIQQTPSSSFCQFLLKIISSSLHCWTVIPCNGTGQYVEQNQCRWIVVLLRAIRLCHRTLLPVKDTAEKNLLLLWVHSKNSALPYLTLWPLLQWWFEKKTLKCARQSVWNKGENCFWAMFSHSEGGFSTCYLQNLLCVSLALKMLQQKWSYELPYFFLLKNRQIRFRTVTKFLSLYIPSSCQSIYSTWTLKSCACCF